MDGAKKKLRTSSATSLVSCDQEIKSPSVRKRRGAFYFLVTTSGFRVVGQAALLLAFDAHVLQYAALKSSGAPDSLRSPFGPACGCYSLRSLVLTLAPKPSTE